MSTISMPKISASRKLVAAVLALVLLLLLCVSVSRATAEEAEIVFTEEEYAQSNNSEQGVNGWYYCYGHADRKYYFLDYLEDQSKWGTHDVTEPYIFLYANGAHPGGSYDAIKLWVADADGVADIGLKAHLAKSSSTDGVKISVMYKSKETGTVTEIGSKTLASDETGSITSGSER